MLDRVVCSREQFSFSTGGCGWGAVAIFVQILLREKEKKGSRTEKVLK